ncbi:MAG: long-chain acyl-CoA synthetase [Actinomycetota bacterium]|nr:long-chain acyl-CoA synthetase [Actinomycetota bacterium]
MYAGDHAKDRPDDPLIVMATSGEVVSFAQYEAACNRMAQLYRDLGLQRLDHVAFFMENNPRMLECEGGAERTGLYYTCINSYLAAEEAAYIVNDSEARVVVSSAALAATANQLPAMCPDVQRWLMVDTDQPQPPWEAYAHATAKYPAEPVADEQLGAAMLYSSGTTGRPKGILRPLPDVHPGTPLPLMDFVKFMFGFREGMHYLSPAPLYHSAPQASVAAAIRLGSTAVIMERFDPAEFLRLVEHHRITHSQMVPTMFSRLLKLPDDVRKGADVSSLEAVVHAAAPCPVPVKEQMIEWWGPIIREYYGATEGNGFTFCTSEEWLAHPGTVGKTVLGETLILDDDGRPCATGTPGVVWFKGATSFEYYNDPTKTAESRDASGEASTVGDVGYLDEDGYLYLTDRKTYMIISGGVNIYPQETENLLITHPKVMDAAVLGVPNEDLGEEVKAVVQAVPGVAVGPELERELIAFCREHLAKFKCPRSVDFEDELPRLPTGKLYKRLLRDRYWEGHSSTIL